MKKILSNINSEGNQFQRGLFSLLVGRSGNPSILKNSFDIWYYELEA